MELVIDPDVKAVAEFMQSSMPAAKLRAVASAIAELAPILWAQYEAESIAALRLTALPINAVHAEHKPQAARSPALEPSCADGDFAVAAS